MFIKKSIIQKLHFLKKTRKDKKNKDQAFILKKSISIYKERSLIASSIPLFFSFNFFLI